MKFGIRSLAVAALFTTASGQCPDYTGYSQVCSNVFGIVTTFMFLEPAWNTIDGTASFAVHAAFPGLPDFQQLCCGGTCSLLSLLGL